MEIPSCLKKISPNWYELLKRCAKMSDAYNGTYGLNIEKNSVCIVGEAHYFNSNYSNVLSDDYCKVCDKISMQFACVMNRREPFQLYGLKSRPRSLKYVVERFCRHFKKHHGDLMK